MEADGRGSVLDGEGERVVVAVVVNKGWECELEDIDARDCLELL